MLKKKVRCRWSCHPSDVMKHMLRQIDTALIQSLLLFRCILAYSNISTSTCESSRGLFQIRQNYLQNQQFKYCNIHGCVCRTTLTGTEFLEVLLETFNCFLLMMSRCFFLFFFFSTDISRCGVITKVGARTQYTNIATGKQIYISHPSCLIRIKNVGGSLVLDFTS